MPGENRPPKNVTGANRPKHGSRMQSGLGRDEPDLAYVFSDALRVNMLKLLNEEDLSKSDLADRFDCSLRRSKYHVDILVQHGCAVEIGTVRNGRGEKKLYRARREVSFPTNLWRKLDPRSKDVVIGVTFEAGYEDAEVAIEAGAFRSRPESHATHTHVKVNEAGWAKIVDIFDAAQEAALEVGEDCKSSARMGEKAPLTVSVNLSAFVLPEGYRPFPKRRSKPD